MSEAVQFTIGSHVSCSDGTQGEIVRVIIDPVDEEITHLVVEPGHKKAQARLVPLDLVDETDGQVRLRCDRAEFDRLDPAEETHFMPDAGGSYPGYGRDQVGVWPHYSLGQVGSLGRVGMSGTEVASTLIYDTRPKGEVDVHRGDPVEATDGDIGRVQGLVIDQGSHHVTHVLLQEGHLWGRRQVAIPISAVISTDHGIRLNIPKQEVRDLPSVDARHPNAAKH
jgi:sporulation protein YlmC with PRC-barrel domain